MVVTTVPVSPSSPAVQLGITQDFAIQGFAILVNAFVGLQPPSMEGGVDLDLRV